MLKISYAGCLGLSPAISAQFTFEVRVAAQNRQKITKTPYFRFQGHSRSSMLTFLRSSWPVLVMISSMPNHSPICNHFHVKRVNIGEITLFKGCLSFFPSFVRTPFTQWHEILSQNTRGSKLSYDKNQKSLSRLGSDRYRVVADTETELAQLIRAIASSRA